MLQETNVCIRVYRMLIRDYLCMQVYLIMPYNENLLLFKTMNILHTDRKHKVLCVENFTTQANI